MQYSGSDMRRVAAVLHVRNGMHKYARRRLLMWYRTRAWKRCGQHERRHTVRDEENTKIASPGRRYLP